MNRRVQLPIDGSNAGENFPFDGLQQSTATRRNVGNFVCHAELVDAGYGVAATDQRERTVGRSLGDGLSNCAGTGGEVVEFKYTGRAVPQNRLGTFDSLGEEFARFGTGIKTFPTVRNSVGRNDLRIGIVGEGICCYAVGTQYQINAFGLGFGNDVERQVQFIVLADRLTTWPPCALAKV